MNLFSFQSAHFDFGFETAQLTLIGIYYIFGYITVLRLLSSQGKMSQTHFPELR